MAQILVVEDSDSSRLALTARLTQKGHTVTAAADGAAALAQLARVPCDLVITDLMMPRMDGWELLRSLREQYPELPAIVLTSDDHPTSVLQAIRDGAIFDYLTKPLGEAPTLDMAIDRALHVRTLRLKAREADQVRAMKELAMTAGDRILNPLNVVVLALYRLEHDPSPATVAKIRPELQAMMDRITLVVRQMSAILRYTPKAITAQLREIDLEAATARTPTP